MIDPKKILITCKAKTGNKEYANLEVEYLFRTLKKYGGKLSDCKKIACFNENPENEIVKVLNDLEVDIRVVDPVDERVPGSHKIRMLDIGIKENVDYTIMLGTDIIITGDFSKYIFGEKLKAKPVDMDILTMNEWKNLFEYLNIEFPKERFMTSCTPYQTIPYFNEDVVIVPKNIAPELYKNWIEFVKKLSDIGEKLPNGIFKHSWFFSQISLALSIQKAKIPYEILPLEMNYPYIGKVNDNENPEQLSPLLIHHHHCISDKGDILHCPYKNINHIVDEINIFLRKNRTQEIKITSEITNLEIKNLLFSGQYQKIIERLKDLAIDSKNYVAQYSLAYSLHITNQKMDESLRRYTCALENGHEPFWIYFNRGSLYYSLDEMEKARKDLEKAKEIKPYHDGVIEVWSMLEEKTKK
jgi:tetratricopeptide (TPR) repeat protein